MFIFDPVDGDVLNSLAMEMDELWDIFAGFEPKNHIVDRSTQQIALDVSSMEAISLGIFSDL